MLLRILNSVVDTMLFLLYLCTLINTLSDIESLQSNYTAFSKCVTHYGTFKLSSVKMSVGSLKDTIKQLILNYKKERMFVNNVV